MRKVYLIFGITLVLGLGVVTNYIFNFNSTTSMDGYAKPARSIQVEMPTSTMLEFVTTLSEKEVKEFYKAHFDACNLTESAYKIEYIPERKYGLYHYTIDSKALVTDTMCKVTPTTT